MITEDYVSFEIAKLLKEKGFPQNPNVCNTAYTFSGKLSNNAKSFAHNAAELDKLGIKPQSYSMAPTLQMAMRQLREAHNLHITIKPYITTEGVMYAYEIYKLEWDMVSLVKAKAGFENNENACEDAINYCLTNLIE